MKKNLLLAILAITAIVMKSQAEYIYADEEPGQLAVPSEVNPTAPKTIPGSDQASRTPKGQMPIPTHPYTSAQYQQAAEEARIL